MLNEKDCIDIIYELYEAKEQPFYFDFGVNTGFAFYRFINIEVIQNFLSQKNNYHYTLTYYSSYFNNLKELKIIYNNLCHKGILTKRDAYKSTEYSLKKYKNYTLQGDFFKLLNKRYILTKKQII